ncbi:MAG TPA: gluconate:proton symporter [Negativicutes bacterium]|nr:gluconate:proton symporter [Negativicutes bacterium]
MDSIQIILLLAVYVGLVIFAMRGGNLIFGFIVSALAWAVIGQVPYMATINDIIQKGAESYGPTAIVVIFGSWFGRMLVETNIAGSLIRRAVELGGDKQLVTTILVSIVTTFIFTSTFGVGAVIAIGVIALPVLFSIGVPERVAVPAFTMSIGAAMYINQVLFKQIVMFFPKDAVPFNGPYFTFGVTAMAVSIAIIILMLVFNLSLRMPAKAWAVTAPQTNNAMHVPFIAYIVPIVPVVMAVAFNWPPLPGIILAIILTLVATGRLLPWSNAQSMLLRALKDGTTDVALLLGMLFMLAMFGAAAGKVAPIFKAVLGPFIPTNPWVIAIAFGVLAPLGLFRGPLMAWGAGSATIAILVGMKLFPPALLLPLVYVPTISMAIAMCPTQSWNLWSISFSKLPITEHLKTGVAWAWLTVIVNALLAVYMFR